MVCWEVKITSLPDVKLLQFIEATAVPQDCTFQGGTVVDKRHLGNGREPQVLERACNEANIDSSIFHYNVQIVATDQVQVEIGHPDLQVYQYPKVSWHNEKFEG